ncbi:MAG TPA: HTTM domain-containing protein, partial [Myxococcota bacterium]
MTALQRLWRQLVQWTDADVDVDVFSRLRLFLGLAAVCKSIGLVSPLPRLAQGMFKIGLPAHRYGNGGTFPPALGAWWSWWPTASNELYRGVEVAALVFAVSMTLGVLSRWSTLLTGLCALWLLVVDPAGFKHNLFALGVFCVLLALAPCGARLSIDALVRRRLRRTTTTTTTTWALPLVLIQLQVGVIYLFSTLRKLNDGWSTGHLLRSSIEKTPAILAQHGLQCLEPLVTFVPMYVVGAWLTLLVEGFLAVGFYARRTRPWALFLGVGLHLWIDL